MRPLNFLGVAFCLLLVAFASPSVADVGGRRADVSQDDRGDVTVRVGDVVRHPTSRPHAPSDVRCRWYSTTGLLDRTGGRYTPAGALEEGHTYRVVCIDLASGAVVSDRFVVHRPGVPAVTGTDLALEAAATLAVAFPVPRTNPDRDDLQLPGIETWLWIEPGSWQPASATAAIPGLSATVEATPVAVVWDPGDGSLPIRCPGPGTPYDPERPAADQSTDCAHTYQDRGRYTASATITWELTWTASDGAGGTLEPVERTTTFPVSVGERQAVGR